MISAKVIADSIAPNGKRITTFELEYPRFIHSEFMTHRALSKNAASSRAIPVSATIRQITDDPAMPVYWGKNQSGMTAKEEVEPETKDMCQAVWLLARDAAIEHVKTLIDLGLHKQIVNRILEPWVHIKVVVTATDWDNFFHLRNHPDAQPEIHALAEEMLRVFCLSYPKCLGPLDWHLPYVTQYDLDAFGVGDCLKLSASLCAQASYRKSDESMEKALLVYDRLVTSVPVHASPFEHQATPAPNADDRSGNFKGWVQHRQLIPNNVCEKYMADLRPIPEMVAIEVPGVEFNQEAADRFAQDVRDGKVYK